MTSFCAIFEVKALRDGLRVDGLGGSRTTWPLTCKKRHWTFNNVYTGKKEWIKKLNLYMLVFSWWVQIINVASKFLVMYFLDQIFLLRQWKIKFEAYFHKHHKSTFLTIKALWINMNWIKHELYQHYQKLKIISHNMWNNHHYLKVIHGSVHEMYIYMM